MICRRLLANGVKGLIKYKQYSRSLVTHFYNNDIVVERPFKHVVLISFPGHDRIPTSSQTQFRSVFQQLHGPVRAAAVNLAATVGYVCYESEESKLEALNSLPDTSLPFNYQVSDYFHFNVNENKFPFTAMVVAAYRPSVHDVGKVMLRFLEYGNMNGTQIITCPYDSDRAFLYCSYSTGREMHAACDALSTIPGSSVAHDPDSCSEDVHACKFGDIEFRRYNRSISFTSDYDIKYLPMREIVQFAEQYGEIVEKKLDKPRHRLLIKYAYPHSVFKLFYENSFFGRRQKTLEKSGKKVYLSPAFVQHKTQFVYGIQFTNLANCPDDPLTYFSTLLDLAGCNPGIVRIDFDDVTNHAWVKVPLPWYVRDISCKVHQFLQSGSVPEEYAGLEVTLFSPYWECEYIDQVNSICEELEVEDGELTNCEDVLIENEDTDCRDVLIEENNHDIEDQGKVYEDESQVFTYKI